MFEKLAIHGGTPIRKEFLPYGHQWIDEKDIKAVSDVLKTDWITQGPKVAEFERLVSDYCNAKYAIAFSSGTAALHAATFTAGISEGIRANAQKFRNNPCAQAAVGKTSRSCYHCV